MKQDKLMLKRQRMSMTGVYICGQEMADHELHSTHLWVL
jgi:hypothetical protein